MFDKIICRIFWVCLLVLLPFCCSWGKSSYIPKIYLEGFTGSGIIGQGDVLAPIFLSQKRALFVYGQGRFNKFWSGSLGVGYRQIEANTFLWGAYALGDYREMARNKSLWIISPGLEVIGKVWDLHINGYIPMGKTDWETSGWADDFGNYNYVSYQGHDEYDAWFVYHDEVGPGGDAEIGRNLFIVDNMLVRGLVNGYYFYMKYNNAVFGMGAKITLQPNDYLKFSANYTYDSYEHSVFMAGIQLSLNRLFSRNVNRSAVEEEVNLEDRLIDPVERNFRNLNPESRSDPTIITKPLTPPEDNNVWWFDTDINGVAYNPPGSTGSYEDPLKGEDFTQETLTNIYQDAQKSGYDHVTIRVGMGGSYNLSHNLTGQINIDKPVELFKTMSLYGWDRDLNGPANGVMRPLLSGALILDGSNTLDSIKLQNNKAQFDQAITMTNADKVKLNNVLLGSLDKYKTGIYMNNSSVVISNSTIYADTTGISMQNGGTLNLNNSNIDVTSINNGAGIMAGEYNYLEPGPKNNSIIIANNNINISNSSINVAASGDAYGVLVGIAYASTSNANIYIGNNVVNINNSVINSKANNNSYGVLIGVGKHHTYPGYIRNDNYVFLCSNTLSISGAQTAITSQGSEGAFDIVLGVNNIYLGEVINEQIDITQNKILITGIKTLLASSDTYDATARIGMLVGVATIDNNYSYNANYQMYLEQNQITMNNVNKIEINGYSNNTDAISAGVLIGGWKYNSSYGEVTEVIDKNNLAVSGSTFTFIGNKDMPEFGIRVSGMKHNLFADNTWNFINNNFYRTDGGINGAEIVYPDDSEKNW